ncbi:MAG TPA: cytochrome c biogenesis protein ResB [Aeromicrobium sp.]|nr:cytochrome c biogenesis protein ResB [Aeromicrobium sp.]
MTTRDDETAPELSRTEFARWIWRQLTSMRTALVLLLLLALVAIPGSVLPQASVDARAVEAYRLAHPALAPWLDRLGVFHTYSSVWFSAVYLLLMTSLVGCIVPRTFAYAKSFAARPPKAPANFTRMPASATTDVDASPATVVGRARTALGRARVDVVERDDVIEISAESRQLRELGNLLFHLAVVGVLVGVAVGSLLGYRGSAVVTEGDDFSNVLTQYDDFASGALFKPESLPPFTFHLAAVDARFQLTGPQRGAPRYFAARGTLGGGKPFTIRVNHPLTIGGTSVFLIGQGYAPVFKVTDAKGDVVFEDAMPFLPSDGTYTSSGVVKVPDARPDGLGFQGFFLPTAITTGKGEAPISAFPAAANPFVGLFVFHGDLGLDDGLPQSVFSLDKSRLKQFKNSDGTPFRVSLTPGQVADLPGGGSIEFVEVRQFARLRIGSAPLAWLPLSATILGVAGLVLSLMIRPRRTWLRIRPANAAGASRTVVEIAALDRIGRGGGDLEAHVRRVADALEGES